MRDHGVGAPAHRWAVAVALLVALASLPTFAAISAGQATLGQRADSGDTTPFIAQPSDIPVVIVPQRPAVLPPPVRPTDAGPSRQRERREPRQRRGHRQRADHGSTPGAAGDAGVLSGAQPGGAYPSGAQPGGAYPSGAQPGGAIPSGAHSGAQPGGAIPSGQERPPVPRAGGTSTGCSTPRVLGWRPFGQTPRPCAD